MIAPLNSSTGKKTIKLLPQEQEGNYKFDGQFVATSAAVEKFGEVSRSQVCATNMSSHM